MSDPPNREWQRRRIAVATGVGVVTVVGVVAILWQATGGRKSRDLQQLLKDNGFVELRPPSTLIKPGAWVEVQGRNPLRLRTICSAETALSVSKEQLALSTSTDTSITRTLSGNFSVDLTSLGLGQAGDTAKIVEAVELRLSKVRLIELPDDQILEDIPKRQKPCAEAIKLRYQHNPQSMTMIDSVLIANADYHIVFSSQANISQKASVLKRVANDPGGSIEVQGTDTTVVLGSDLVWGVKDNQLMAFQGLGLPNVGGELQKSRSILQGSGPIAAIDLTEQARNNYLDMPARVRVDVSVVRQLTPNGCWAAVYTMMMSWKAKAPVSISSAVSSLGAPYTTYLAADTGLPGGHELEFVKTAGLHAMPPAAYPLSFFRNMLREKGPMWIVTGDGLTSHARLLVGIYGPDEREIMATYRNTVMEFVDPASGAYIYEPSLVFLGKFERETTYVINHHLDWIDLRWQIVTF